MIDVNNKFLLIEQLLYNYIWDDVSCFSQNSFTVIVDMIINFSVLHVTSNYVTLFVNVSCNVVRVTQIYH